MVHNESFRGTDISKCESPMTLHLKLRVLGGSPRDRRLRDRRLHRSHYLILLQFLNKPLGKIYPVPSVGGIEIGSSTPNDLLPPVVRRPPGRPRKVRILSHGEKEAPHPLGNANVVAIQVTTRHPTVTLYKKYVTMEKAYEGSSKLLFGNWVNKRKPLPSTDWPSK
ncbi:hypothetical protein DY000_02033429 [Brassica cretica]|uniref:Uncharacterized protein n=1 Tax=Brassica cretica TaxID=69181 RepID=A0ABQ7DXU2_BRACR|nr:hypothetical protein DY000_02033429 [Brassica cretica]